MQADYGILDNVFKKNQELLQEKITEINKLTQERQAKTLSEKELSNSFNDLLFLMD